MYDKEFAERRQRAPVAAGARGHCLHCAYLGFLTGSDYEFPCLILDDWICETHCAEVQLRSYPDTRRRMAEQIAWEEEPDRLLKVCRRCPYYFVSEIELNQGLANNSQDD